jgi:hypothetical protein
MAKYRTALGKVVDMSVLASRNEKTRAVGNMKVNARGDTIDAFGRVIKPATSKVNEAYSKTVGNRSAQPVAQKPKRVGNDSVPQKPVTTPAPTRSAVNQRIDEVDDVILPEPVVQQAPVVQPKIVEEVVEEQLTQDELDLDRELDDDELVEQIKAMESNLPKAKK